MAIQGSLKSVSIPDLFSLVCQLRLTGVLSLVTSAEERGFFFQDGNLAFATTKDGRRRLGNFLVHLGFVEEHELGEIHDLASGRDIFFGRQLVESDRISQAQLDTAVRTQVLDVLKEVLNWQDGAFHFDDVEPPFNTPLESLLATRPMLLESARLRDESGYVATLFPEVTTVFECVEPRPVDADADQHAILGLINGITTIEELSLRSPLGPKGTANALETLLKAGAIRERETTESEEEDHPKLRCFPVAPEIPGRIFSRLGTSASEPEVRDVLAGEPMLVAKVLRALTLGNVEIRRTSMSVDELIDLLGPFQLRCLLSPEAVRGLFYPEDSCYWEELWEHSKICAQVCEFVATQIEYSFPGEAYLAGLLHNIGAFILLTHDPNRYRALVDHSVKVRRDLEDLEREAYGVSHTEIGGIYAKRWNFPRLLRRAIEQHHHVDIASSNPLIHIVSIANGLAQASGYRVGYQSTLGVQFEESLRKLKLDKNQASALYQHVMQREKPGANAAAPKAAAGASA